MDNVYVPLHVLEALYEWRNEPEAKWLAREIGLVMEDFNPPRAGFNQRRNRMLKQMHGVRAVSPGIADKTFLPEDRARLTIARLDAGVSNPLYGQ